MTDEHKQRLADYRMERSVWSDGGLQRNGSDVNGKSEPESKEISLERLGGRKVGHHTPSGKPVDLSAAYGETGKLVCEASEPDVPEEN
jgi:hypothetical protein